MNWCLTVSDLFVNYFGNISKMKGHILFTILFTVAQCTPIVTHELQSLFEALDNQLEGNIIIGDLNNNQYNRERTQWNSEYNNYYPLAIIMVESEEDISLSLKELILNKNSPKLSFRVRSAELGGHLWNGYSVANNSIIFDLSRLNTIEKISNTNNIFKIGVGSSQRNVNRNLEPYFSLIPTSGDCPQFSFGGFIQGGGLSLFLRSLGIAADYLIAADVVLTNGKIVQFSYTTKFVRFTKK